MRLLYLKYSLINMQVLLLLACTHSPYRYNDYKSYQQSTGLQVTEIAMQQLGVPYVYGGNSPAGFDCSGLVQYSYNQLGIQVPRTVAKLRRFAKPIPINYLRPGDLIFFNIEGQRVSHVGIYVRPDTFIHAPKRGRTVSIANLNSPYWQRRIVSAGRLNSHSAWSLR